jgi:hypothetical protein
MNAMPVSGDPVRAAVLTAAETLEIQTFPLPALGDDDALVRVEVCGLGGSDITQYLGKLRRSSAIYPVIPRPRICRGRRVDRRSGFQTLASGARRARGSRGDRALLGLSPLCFR